MTKTTHYTTKKQIQMIKTTITLEKKAFDAVVTKSKQNNQTKSGYIEKLILNDLKANINALLD